jgi:hypothetical protein
MNLGPPRLIRQKNREDSNVPSTDYAWLWEHVNQEKIRTFIEPISLPQHIWRDLRDNIPSLEDELIAARQRYYNRLPPAEKARYHVRPPPRPEMRFRYAKSPVARKRKSPAPKMRYAKSPGRKKSSVRK